jgi:hypothetical protein
MRLDYQVCLEVFDMAMVHLASLAPMDPGGVLPKATHLLLGFAMFMAAVPV